MNETVSDEQLLEFLYQAPVGLIQLNEVGDIVFMTPKAIQLLIPISENVELTNIFDVLSRTAPELRNKVDEFDKRRGVILDRHRCAVHDAEGKIRIVLELMLNKLSPERMVMSINDITKLVQKEREALLGSQMIDSIVQNIQGQKVCVLNEEGIIESWNASGERLNGYKADEIVGKYFSWLVDIPDEIENEHEFSLPSEGVAEFTTASEWPGLLEEARNSGVVKVTSRHHRKDGTIFWGDSTISVLRDAESIVTGFLVVTRDITDEYKRVLSLEQMALTDPLTGALNRRAFFDRAGQQAKLIAEANDPFSVVMIDLDHFKQLNDTYGHAAGDAVLKAVSEVCINSIRSDDIFARYGGEEFVLFLANANPERAMQISERIRSAITELRVEFEGQSITVSASLGVAESKSAEAFNDVLKNADKALYTAKNAGRNQAHLFDAA